MMGRFLAVLLAVVLVAVVLPASVFAAPHGHLRKTVYVNVGGAAGGAGGSEAAAVAKPVPYPVPVPVPVEVPVAVPVEKPVYVESKPVVPVQGGGQAQGAVYGTVHLNTGNFFDNIFNIPISVLRSVNQFLNNNVRGAATVHVGAVKHGYGGFVAQPVQPAQAPVHAAAGAGADSTSSASSSAQSSSQSAAESSAQSSAQSSSQSSSQSAADSSASSSAQSSSSSSAGAAGGAVLYKNKSPTFYNDIFNIPVSALTSVNTLLTGGR